METKVLEKTEELTVAINNEEEQTQAQQVSKLEDYFFWGEVVFLLTTIAMSMYSIYADKELYVWVLLLGMYVFTIKSFRRLFTDHEALQKIKTKIIIGVYLTISTIGCLSLVYWVIKSIA